MAFLGKMFKKMNKDAKSFGKSFTKSPVANMKAAFGKKKSIAPSEDVVAKGVNRTPAKR